MIAATTGPKVSVLVANHNNVDHLPALLESVRRQQVPGGVEVVVIDDASTDASYAYLSGQPDVRTLRLPRQSGSNALPFNAAVSVARGEYVAFLDGDDILVDPTALDQLTSALDQDRNAEVAVSNVVFIRETPELAPEFGWTAAGGPGGTHAWTPGRTAYLPPNASGISQLTRRSAQSWSFFDQLVHGTHLGLRVARTHLVRSHGSYPIELGPVADAGFLARVAARERATGQRLVLPVDVDGYGYRLHSSNVTTSGTIELGSWRREVVRLLRTTEVNWQELVAANAEQAARGFDPIVEYWGLQPQELQPAQLVDRRPRPCREIGLDGPGI